MAVLVLQEIQPWACLRRKGVTNTILKTREVVSLKNQLNTCLTNLEEKCVWTLAALGLVVAVIIAKLFFFTVIY